MLTKIAMIMLGVTNMDRSVVFYRDLLGMQLANQSGEFSFFSGGGIMIGLNAGLGKAVPPTRSSLEVVFAVDSVTATYSELSGRGVKFLHEPRAVSGENWAATLSDPDGHMLTLFGLK
jgi:predicted enzyme related to lactoylglutathione lyase